jgi:hypothetical protein
LTLGIGTVGRRRATPTAITVIAGATIIGWVFTQLHVEFALTQAVAVDAVAAVEIRRGEETGAVTVTGTAAFPGAITLTCRVGGLIDGRAIAFGGILVALHAEGRTGSGTTGAVHAEGGLALIVTNTVVALVFLVLAYALIAPRGFVALGVIDAGSSTVDAITDVGVTVGRSFIDTGA